MSSGYIIDNIDQIDKFFIKTKTTTTTKLYRRLRQYNYRHTATRDQQTPYRNLPWDWGMKTRRLRWNWITIRIKINRWLFSNKTWIPPCSIHRTIPNTHSQVSLIPVREDLAIDFTLASCHNLYCITTRIQIRSYIRGNEVYLYVGWPKFTWIQSYAGDGMMFPCNNTKPNH